MVSSRLLFEGNSRGPLGRIYASDGATVTGMFLSGKKLPSTKSKLSFEDDIRSILRFGLAIFLISELLGNL